MKQNYESGRSMVEMLGTLAIIGVLSVGGIMGYSYGMDKYRANTIMNDIMLRAVDSISQFNVTGDANLSEWPTTTVGKYAIGLENETIGIQVSDLPKRLCEMVFDGMINNATVKIGTTEYDSATDDDVCGDTNTMVFYVDDAAGSTTEETTTITTTTTEETTTTTTEEVSEGNCASNSECETNEYCAVGDYPIPEEPFPHRNGICTSFDYYRHTITVNGVNEVWYVSKQSVENYWDAYHVCEKLSATMVSLGDLYSDTDFFINNYRADLLANVVHFGSGSSILVSDKKGLVARLGQHKTGGSFDDTGGFVLCYEGTLADL